MAPAMPHPATGIYSRHATLGPHYTSAACPDLIYAAAHLIVVRRACDSPNRDRAHQATRWLGGYSQTNPRVLPAVACRTSSAIARALRLGSWRLGR